MRDSVTLAPVAGARIELGHSARDSAESIRVITADRVGRASLALPPGALRAAAWHTSSTAGPVHVELLEGEAAEVELLLVAGHELAGRVVDAVTGAPIEGATVAVWTFAERDVVRTLDDGSFRHARFPASDFAEQIRVEAPGYGPTIRYLVVEGDGRWEAPSPTDEALVTTGHGHAWIEVGLVPEVRIAGRVVDTAGRPLVAAVVAEGFFHALPSIASRDGAETNSQSDGTFALEGLRSDIGHSLIVDAPGFARSVLEVPPGIRDADEVTRIVLSRASALAGFVVDPEGYPVEDIEVALVAIDASSQAYPSVRAHRAMDVEARVDAREFRGRTSPEGSFVFDRLREGAYELTIVREAEALVTTRVQVDGTGDAPAVEVRLPVESMTMAGRVLGARALTDISVAVSRFGEIGRATVDADGRFRVAGLDASLPYTVEVRALRRGTHTPVYAEVEGFAYEPLAIQLEARDADYPRIAQAVSE